MNRLLKFRAWNVATKTMVDLRKITPLILDQDVSGIFIPDETDGLFAMQYTGLLDKHGKPIFEGDVVRCVNEHIGVVEWEEHDCCFNVTGYYAASDDYPTMAFMGGQPFEILGNIYEHSDLLNSNSKEI